MTDYPGYRGPDLGGNPEFDDDRPDLSRTYWTVVWDYVGGDCGDLPGTCDTEAEAAAYGQNWVDDTLADLRSEMLPDEYADMEASGEGMPVYHVVRHEVGPDGGEDAFDEGGKRMYSIDADGTRYRSEA